ncbi:MAG: protein kinase, partial [Myxococcota bacterium]
MRLTPGMTVNRYEIETLVGFGGMAQVWQVRHRKTNSRYALKVLHRASDRLQRRLLREGRAQAQLHHPALLPVSDILDVQGYVALLMPLITGPSLSTLLRRYRPLLPEALALYIQDVADGQQRR